MHDDHRTKSPCVKVCKFSSSGDAGVCLACFRTRYEVRRWKRLPDAERGAINQRVRPLMGDSKARKEGKRLRKIEKRIAKLEKRLRKLAKERQALLTGQLDGTSNR
jgi:predicted Fe-S protein YdhL (DUF1289 family)